MPEATKQSPRKGTGGGLTGFIPTGNFSCLVDEAEGITFGYGEAEYGPFGIPSSQIEYDEGANIRIVLIESEWFRINQESAQKLVVEVQENDSGAERKLALPIQCGNYFTQIEITQQ